MPQLNVAQDSSAARLAKLRRINHPGCILCGHHDRLGLGLDFVVTDDGDVTAQVECDEFYQSYNGLVHGGILTLLLDGAMTNCLFATGVTAVTAEMTTRYLCSAATDRRMTLRARVTRSRPPLHLVEAELRQGGKVVARASGKFMER